RGGGRVSPGDVDELEAAAAEIAGDAVGGGNAHERTARGKLRFARAGEDRDARADRLLAARNELGPVLGFAHGGGRDYAHVLHAEHAIDGMEAAQRLDGALDGVGVEPAGR